MGKAVIAAFLSILFYLTSLLNGGQQLPPVNAPEGQHSFSVLGQNGRVLAERAILRRIPDNQGEVVGTVKQNESLLILDERLDWYHVRLNSQQMGWLPKYALSLAPVEKEESNKIILGYYTGDQHAYESLLSRGAQLTGIAPLGWQLTPDGVLLNRFNPEKIGRGLYFAGNQELSTYAYLELPQNTSVLLNSAELQLSSLEAIEAALAEWGLKGIILNVADIPAAEQERLFTFVTQLTTRLKQKDLFTFLALSWDTELNLALAAEAADLIIIETANLRATAPGPPASVAKLKAMLPSILEQIPKEKVILAFSNVGLNWAEGEYPDLLSYTQVMQLAANKGVDIKWDTQSQTPYFQYGDGHELWFENRYSIKYKLELISEFELAGIAFLQLGQEDPDVWNVLANSF